MGFTLQLVHYRFLFQTLGMTGNSSNCLLYRLARTQHLMTWLCAIIGPLAIASPVYEYALGLLPLEVRQRYARLAEFENATAEQWDEACDDYSFPLTLDTSPEAQSRACEFLAQPSHLGQPRPMALAELPCALRGCPPHVAVHAAKSNGKRFTVEEVKAAPKHLQRKTIEKARKAIDSSEKGAPPPSARHSRLAKLPSHTAHPRHEPGSGEPRL